MGYIKSFIGFFLLGCVSCYALNICEKQCHLFKNEPTPTEETAYRLLKTCTSTMNATYLAVPWVVLENQIVPALCKNNASLRAVQPRTLADESHHQLPWVDAQNEKLANLLGTQAVDNGFVVCQHIFFRTLVPYLKKLGVNTIFTPHAKEEYYMGVRIEPFPIYPKNGVNPAKHKDIWFSFIGNMTHRCRHRVMKLAKTPNTVIQLPARAKQTQQRFKTVLAKSRFSLCPRGTGPSSIRFWESLQAGAIPVLIADGLRLPDNFDWDRCIVRVAQADIHKIPDILTEISTEREAQMRAACLEAHQLFSGKNFISPILHHYRSFL